MPSPRNRPSLTSLVAFVLIVLAGYVLSPGPVLALVIALTDEAGFSETLILFPTVFYSPLGWCCENAEWVDSFYAWYLNLWGLE